MVAVISQIESCGIRNNQPCEGNTHNSGGDDELYRVLKKHDWVKNLDLVFAVSERGPELQDATSLTEGALGEAGPVPVPGSGRKVEWRAQRELSSLIYLTGHGA